MLEPGDGFQLESLPAERIRGLRLASVEVAFKGELFYGDHLRAGAVEVPSDDNVSVFLHKLVRVSDGKIAAAARSRWVEEREPA